jgi:hypothetical protein
MNRSEEMALPRAHAETSRSAPSPGRVRVGWVGVAGLRAVEHTRRAAPLHGSGSGLWPGILRHVGWHSRGQRSREVYRVCRCARWHPGGGQSPALLSWLLPAADEDGGRHRRLKSQRIRRTSPSPHVHGSTHNPITVLAASIHSPVSILGWRGTVPDGTGATREGWLPVGPDWVGWLATYLIQATRRQAGPPACRKCGPPRSESAPRYSRHVGCGESLLPAAFASTPLRPAGASILILVTVSPPRGARWLPSADPKASAPTMAAGESTPAERIVIA